MSDEAKGETQEAIPAEAVVRRRRGISIVWAVPIIAAIVAGGLWIQALRERGPLVTVVFDDGNGLEAGKTVVLFQGVAVGTVESVDLSQNLETVVTQIRLEASAERMAQDGAKYWIVRPSFGIGGLTGLETLVSGPYIGVVPGDGASQTDFTGVSEPPMEATRMPGLRILLEADQLGSLTLGSPVAFRKIQIGEVTGYALRKDKSKVDLTVTVYDAHRELIREGSRFWNASGVKVTIGAGGLKVKSQSLAALLLGGISVVNPGGTTITPPARSGASFRLYRSEHEFKRRDRIREGLNIRLESTSLGSVRPGDPVSYREVQVGEVIDAELAPGSQHVFLSANIWKEYAPLVRTNSRFWNASGIRAHFGLFSGLDISVESLESLVSGGVAFATPDDPGGEVPNGTAFSLADAPKDNWLSWAPRLLSAVGGVVRAPAKLVKKGVNDLTGSGRKGESQAVAEDSSQAVGAPPSDEPKREPHRTPRLHGGPLRR